MREKMDPVRERRARQLGQSRAGVILSPPLPEEGLIGNLDDDRRCRTNTDPPPLSLSRHLAVIPHAHPKQIRADFWEMALEKSEWRLSPFPAGQVPSRKIIPMAELRPKYPGVP